MVDVTTEILINRPRDEVATFASDPDNAAKWYINIKAVEWRTPKPLAHGSKIAFKAVFLGRQLEYVYEIVKIVPGQTLVMQTAGEPFLMETTYRWYAVDGSATRMELRNRGEPTGFFKLLVPLISRAMKNANRKDLNRLKEILEK